MKTLCIIKFYGNKYIERIESLPPESKVSRFCMEAGFLRIVEVGQYLMTKDTGDFRQFRSVACREYTLFGDDPASQPKGWIQGNMRVGLVLEVTTSFQHFKYGIEIRIKSVNPRQFSILGQNILWNVYVVDSNQNHTEIPADPQEDQVPQTSIKVVAARSKAKAKPQREPVDTPTIIPMHERRLIDIEPSEPTLAAYDLSKKVISLLRHNQTVQREDDGTIQFWRINSVIIHRYIIGLMIVGSIVWQQDLMIRAEFFTSELFRDTLEAISLILRYRTVQWLRVEYSITSTTLDVHSIFTLLSTMDWYPEVRIQERQTVFFLPIGLRDQSRKDLDKIDLNAPRRAQYLHKAWKRSTSILILRKVWNSFRLDRTLSFITKHFQRIVFRELLGWKTGEVIYEKKFTWHLGFHQRSLWNTSWKENCVLNMLNGQKLGKYLEVSNRTNQL